MSKTISVVVKTNSKTPGYEILSNGILKLMVKEKPVFNMANEAVIEKIAEIYGKSKSKIKIKSGLKYKNKIIVIDE